MGRRVLGVVVLLVVMRVSLFGGAADARTEPRLSSDGGTTVVSSAAVDVEPLTRNEVPSQIAVPGTFVEAKQWRDENGTNVYVVYKKHGARTDHKDNKVELYARQYVVGDETRLVWDIYDFVSCEEARGAYWSWMRSVYRSWWGQHGRPDDARYRLRLRTEATEVTDLDADGETETTIAYTKTCDESADVYDLKVLMLEGAEKYGLRGRTLSPDELFRKEVIDIAEKYKLGQAEDHSDQWEGQYKTEANFDDAPPSFLPFAKSKWRAHRRTWDEAHVEDDPASHIDSTELRNVEVQSLSKDEVPPQVQYQGTFVQAKRWTDENGTNVLIVSTLDKQYSSSKKSERISKSELFAKQVVLGDETRRVWDIYDFEEAWEDYNGKPMCTPELSLVSGGGWVTDLNDDAQTETTIAYTKSCKTDVSPVDLKVLLMDGDQKYALRGKSAQPTTVQAVWFWLDRKTYTFNRAKVDSVQKKERPYGGRYKNESSFEGAPDGFLEFARGIWKVSITPWEMEADES